AAQDAEASQARVQTMLKNVGVSWQKHGDHIQGAIDKLSKLAGLDDEELSEAFANMVRSTKDVNEALKLTTLAADLSRTSGMNLASAQKTVAKVYNGSYASLKKLGISIEPVTKAQDALAASSGKHTEAEKKRAKALDDAATKQKAIATLQKQFGGQAAAYGATAAGAADKVKVAWENVQETLGTALLPTLSK